MMASAIVKRAVRALLYLTAGFFALAVALAVIMRILLGWIGDDPARAQSLASAASSPWLAVIRYGLYAAVWFGWRRILSTFVPNLSPELAQATRRPIAMLIIAYELLFALNVLSFVL